MATNDISMSDARSWAKNCNPGDYLIWWDDVEGDDPGSRGGFGDDELDELSKILRARDLHLVADDCGLVAQ